MPREVHRPGDPMTDDDFDGDTEPAPMDTEGRLIAVGFCLLVFGLFVAEIVVDYHPVKLTALFIVLFWMPMLAVHEAGHAVVAALLGWHIRRVVIGMGRRVTTFRVGRTPVQLHLFPVEGFVEAAPADRQASRLKSALVYFAGAGAELLLLAGLVAAVGVDTLLTRTDCIGLLAAQSLAVTILIGVFCALVPHYSFTPGEERSKASDGMGILLSLFGSREEIAGPQDRADDTPGKR
ncbi:MAG: site-2 protease family protein [Gemmataceae bacterium]|nr:site-2 protease family protein [Gemmataceae bacterium]